MTRRRFIKTMAKGTLLSALAFGVQVLMIHVFSDHDSFASTTLFQLLVVALCSLGYVLLTRESLTVSPAAWPSLLYLAVFTTVIALLLQNRFQHEVTVAQASLIYSLEPVVATILAVVLLGEPMTTSVLVGGLLMFTASAIS